jgi:hypothetical protein
MDNFFGDYMLLANPNSNIPLNPTPLIQFYLCIELRDIFVQSGHLIMVDTEQRNILRDIAFPPLLTDDQIEQCFNEELPVTMWRNPMDPSNCDPTTTQGCAVKRHVDRIFATLFRDADKIDKPSIPAQNLWRVFNYCNLPCNSMRTNMGENPGRLVRGVCYDKASYDYLQWMDRNGIPVGDHCDPPYLLDVAVKLVPGIVQLCIIKSHNHGLAGLASPEPGSWGTSLPSCERSYHDMKWLLLR